MYKKPRALNNGTYLCLNTYLNKYIQDIQDSSTYIHIHISYSFYKYLFLAGFDRATTSFAVRVNNR